MKKILLILIPIILGTVILMAFNKNETEDLPSQKTIKTVSVTTPQKTTYRKRIVTSGRLATKEEVKLSFKTGGIIRNIKVNEGQYVRKGQLLSELSLNEISAQVEQAQLGIEQSNITIKNAKLAMQLAERDYKNAKGLYQDSVATLEQLENAEIQLNNARNQLEAAQTGLNYNAKNAEIAKFNLQHSHIYAPANGTVLKKLASPNELIAPGNPVFIFGSKDQAQVIRVNITDKDIIYVNFGDDAEVLFDAYPNKVFKGTVKEIASIADPYSGTYEVEIEVDANGRKLLSGFIGQVNLLTKEATDVVSVPIDALVSGNKNKGEVFIIENDIAKKQKVDILKIDGNQMFISNGIEAAQQVVTKGGGYLEHGEKVVVGSLQ